MPEELRLPEREGKEQKVVSCRFVNKSFSHFARYIVTLFLGGGVLEVFFFFFFGSEFCHTLK